jgi:hypothetical protein
MAASVLTLALGGFGARAQEVQLPRTAEEHAAMAKSYEEKAALWRGEAAHHREMAEAYKKYSKSRINPAVAKMEKHCMTIVKDAEKLAADAEESARYHRLRAKEIQRDREPGP